MKNFTTCEQESSLNSGLLVGFILALGFHLLFFTIFHIQPFQIKTYPASISPAHVEVNRLNQAIVFADMHSIKHLSSGLPSFEPSEPSLLNVAHPFADYTIETAIEQESILFNPFKEIEQKIYTADVTLLNKKKREGLHIVVAGPLASLSSLLKVPNFLVPVVDREVRLNYRVLVEGRSGTIFWYESKNKNFKNSLNTFAVEVLNQLHFKPDSTLFVIDGEVEMHFHLSAK